MNHQAQIYLADQRGCSQTDIFRSFHTFNFGNYVAESREAFGNLRALNDDTLSAEHSLKIQLSENTDIVVIPIIGGLEYYNSLQNGFLETKSGLILSGSVGTEYEIINPYQNEYINFVQIWLKNSSPNFMPISEEFSFDLNEQNQLYSIFSVNNQEGFIGKYGGRKKGKFTVKNLENGVFVFVINGVFEVQDRLLHARDGLAIWDIEMIDFEALSNEAVILLISF
jgi:quercetin 2,3-dioxygenase